jgi:hypothetical protein
MGSTFEVAELNIGPRGKSFVGSIHDNALFTRDPEPSMNIDLIACSICSLAKKDSRALLDYEALTIHANDTFQTFIQHFISNSPSQRKLVLAFERSTTTVQKY